MHAQPAGDILLVDDDAELRELVATYLEQNGYRINAVADAAAMDRALAHYHPDLILLDLMMPGEDGLSIARRLRAANVCPMIMLSARGEPVDRIVGLEVGVDDYLPKPFDPRELLARIKAVLRRNAALPRGSLHFGPYVLDIDSRTLKRGGKILPLTTGELTLLSIFAQHPRTVLSRDRLLTLLKGYDRAPFDRSIDVGVTRLRRKIEEDAANPRYIRTVWNAGYLFAPDGEA